MVYREGQARIVDGGVEDAGQRLASDRIIIPTGALSDWSMSEPFRRTMEAYVSGGGTILTFAQQLGKEYAILPSGKESPVAGYGFAEDPDVPQALMGSCDKGGIHFDPMETTYFASRETIVASAHRGMPVWRDKLFAVMHRNAAPATGFFRIPGNRLVELGAQVEI